MSFAHKTILLNILVLAETSRRNRYKAHDFVKTYMNKQKYNKQAAIHYLSHVSKKTSFLICN